MLARKSKSIYRGQRYRPSSGRVSNPRPRPFLIVVAGVLLLVGCQGMQWNWSDHRKNIKPGLDSNIDISSEQWNEIATLLFMEWKLKQDQAAIEEYLKIYEFGNVAEISKK